MPFWETKLFDDNTLFPFESPWKRLEIMNSDFYIYKIELQFSRQDSLIAVQIMLLGQVDGFIPRMITCFVDIFLRKVNLVYFCYFTQLQKVEEV